MQPRLSIRNKLFAFILLILLISSATLIHVTVRNYESFVNRQHNEELEEHLNYARNQYHVRAEQMKISLMHPASAAPVHEHLRHRDAAWLRSALARWQAILPFVELLSIVDARQEVVARFNDEPSGQRLEIGGVVQEAFRSGKPQIASELVSTELLSREGVKEYAIGGRLHEGRLDEALTIVVVVPIIDPAGTLLGGIVAGDVINKDPFLPYQIKKIFGKESELSITQRGLQVASSFRENGRPPDKLEPGILALLEAGQPYRGETRIAGKEYMVGIEPITNFRNEFIGSLSVALSMEDHRQILRAAERNIVLSALAGILFAIAIAFVVARKLTEPLKALSRGAEQFERGEFDHRVVVTTADEFGLLADSFNRMASALSERDRTITKKTRDLEELNALLKELNDLLEKKVADRTSELRMEMGMLEAILTSMAEGVVVTDRDNRVILFNPAAQKIFDLVPHRVLHQPIEQICEHCGFPQLAGFIREIRAEGEAAVVREEEVTVKGKKLKISLSPLLDEAKELAGVVMSIRDVTVEEEVDRMKNEFISTVSHELKTPLTSIKGSLQFIMNKAKWLTGTERELLTVCLRNTERLMRLIGDILDISKIESGRVEMDFRPLSIGELVIYAIEEIKGFALSRNVTIVNSVGDHLPPVYGDHDRLIQVLTNLLANAVKFSPEGKVIMVSAEREDNYVAVSVADHGKEIKWSDRGKLFRKFQQLENAATGGRGGTGLGLAICKEIIERHHGRIHYHSGATGGNVFTFNVPIYEELA